MESRVAVAPAASCAKCRKHTSSSPQVRRNTRPSLRNGFNGFLRALPGDRAFLPPSQATMRMHHRQLDISVGISGPHDFAVRFSIARLATPKRPPHPAPNVRDDREAPLMRARDARKDAGDLPDIAS